MRFLYKGHIQNTTF